MKILLYGINFAPELTGTGKYTAEMAAWLAARGHDVSVITAAPYYPQWKVHAGYSGRHYSHEKWQAVTVERAPLWVPQKPSGAKRLIHLASFAVSSLPLLIRRAFWRPDVMLVVEPALFCAPATWTLARLCGARAWLHIQDFEVDAAFDLGVLKGKTIKRLVCAAEGWLMRRFDRVSTISTRMLERARSKGVPAERLVPLFNWIDLDAITPQSGATAFRRELGIPDDAVVALYSGNMGGKQGLETLAGVARVLRKNANIHFVFCGQGPGRAPLEAACADLPQVHFIDLQPMERLNELLCTSDIHLLPQRRGAADLVMPSKLTGMLASGRPVVCGAAPGTELATVVAHCGIVVEPENVRAMARAIASLTALASRRIAFGQAARRYAVSHLGIDSVLGAFESELRRAIAPRPSDADARIAHDASAHTKP
jgi:colanic acid biosynthesis glycosyl transferase WcaI